MLEVPGTGIDAVTTDECSETIAVDVELSGIEISVVGGDETVLDEWNHWNRGFTTAKIQKGILIPGKLKVGELVAVVVSVSIVVGVGLSVVEVKEVTGNDISLS